MGLSSSTILINSTILTNLIKITEDRLISDLSDILLSLNYKIVENFKVITYLDVVNLFTNNCTDNTNSNPNPKIYETVVKLIIEYLTCVKKMQNISNDSLNQFEIDDEGIIFFKNICYEAEKKYKNRYSEYEKIIKVCDKINKITNEETSKKIIDIIKSDLANPQNDMFEINIINISNFLKIIMTNEGLFENE